jgi:UMP-CMP kinase
MQLIKLERKHLEEHLGLQYLSCLLRNTDPRLAEELPRVWQEYEANESEIARLVHEMDKFECLHQAYIYQKRYRENRSLGEFQSLRDKISDPWLAGQADAILADWATIEHRPPSGPIVFIIGGPGVGKGTLCSHLVQEGNYEHVSVGDLLRHEQDSPESVFGDFIRSSIKHSVVVPPSLTLLLLKERVQQIQASGKGVLIDGFPRSIGQIAAFEKEVSTKYRTIFLHCSTEVMKDRVMQRSALSGRDDDNITTLRKRIDTYEKTTQPIIDHLSRQPFYKNAQGVPRKFSFLLRTFLAVWTRLKM